MRLYKDLELKSKEELLRLQDLVATHSELTIDEKKANLDNIDMYLYGHTKKDQILADINAGLADIDNIND